MMQSYPDYSRKNGDFKRKKSADPREITGKPYDETTDQLKFTREIDIDALLRRQPPMRSFHRFEHAVRQLGESATSGNHACSPRQPD